MDDPGHWRHHLRGHRVDLDLGDELVRRDGGALRNEPRGDDAHRLWRILGEGWKQDVGHLATARRTAASIRSCRGSTAHSSTCAYGIGTSGTATRWTGTVSIVGSLSVTVATTSPDRPNER